MKLDPEVYNVSGEANVSTLFAGLDCLELIGLTICKSNGFIY